MMCLDFQQSEKFRLDKAAILLSGEDKIRTKGNSNEVKAAALRKLVHEGYGRTEANQACADYFRDTYRIWGG
ncbi:hypothetical protein [Hydrogenophaga sp.]|uniref:hypothetical protein n=1 Tax=Hydrogenophaga sp. TaxID=1904254 RepID=UPI002639DEE2|nr:hypothetical protein [Hydrogenophaga sp.]MDM7950134.1 hypothetical protein [Hydrogenophaga sp.]